MLSSQEEQAERRRVLAQDASLRQQQGGSAYIDHYMQEAGGRFSAHAAATVIGTTAIPQYPQASAPFQSDPVPDEPPLGLDNPAFDPGPDVSPAQADPTSADAQPVSMTTGVQRTDVGSFSSGDPAGVHFPSPLGTSSDVKAGSLPRSKRRY